MDGSPFHADELAAQALAGVSTRGAGIRALMSEPHRSFFASLPQVFVSTADANGWPLATLLEGDPGFVEAPDPTTLVIRAEAPAGDPAAGSFRAGQPIGILGIDLATRRRNRANGVITAAGAGGISVSVSQSFGNCPQYIQRRDMRRSPEPPAPAQPLVIPDARARALIEGADTFFVASRSGAHVGAAAGADVSHRGGRPGFVRLDHDTLVIPDFRGNRYFNTLGNLLGEPRAGLLFLDFPTGDVLQLQGLASIEWSAPAAGPEGSERLWRMRIVRGWYRPRASARRGTFIDYAPTTLGTGTWARD